MKRCLRAAVAVAIVSALSLGVLPQPAGSAVDAARPINQEYKRSTKGQGHGAAGPGHVKVEGDLTWYGRRSFAISGKLDDVCPGDGHGAKFGLWIDYRRGDDTWHNLAKDLDGCRSTADVFSRSFNRERRIKRAILFLCEKEGGGSDTCVGFHIWDKDNPFTG